VSVRFTVDLDEVTALVARAEAFGAQVGETSSRLEREVAGLHLTWTGLAADADQRAHREWTAGAREMADALAELTGLAQHAHNEYLSAATDNHRMWSPLA
jgi:WXG100 family type VII secretion target